MALGDPARAWPDGARQTWRPHADDRRHPLPAEMLKPACGRPRAQSHRVDLQRAEARGQLEPSRSVRPAGPIDGLLMTTQGIPLAGQTVRILAAADNGGGSFAEAARARTTDDGQWHAQLPAGPSRVIRVVYEGSSTLLPSAGTARTFVPAGVHLRIAPTKTHWGATIKIVGQALGGYVPASGEVLFLRLRYKGKQIEVAHVRTGRDGRFQASYTFLGGSGGATYPFWVTTVPESDYPFTAGSSRRILVSVRP